MVDWLAVIYKPLMMMTMLMMMIIMMMIVIMMIMMIPMVNIMMMMMKMMMMMMIIYFQMVDWVAVNKSLPYKRTVEEKALRRKMWQGIDVNANGFVSLAEITKVRRRRRGGGELPQAEGYM